MVWSRLGNKHYLNQWWLVYWSKCAPHDLIDLTRISFHVLFDPYNAMYITHDYVSLWLWHRSILPNFVVSSRTLWGEQMLVLISVNQSWQIWVNRSLEITRTLILLRDVITCAYPWYLFLAQKSTFVFQIRVPARILICGNVVMVAVSVATSCVMVKMIAETPQMRPGLVVSCTRLRLAEAHYASMTEQGFSQWEKTLQGPFSISKTLRGLGQ